MYIVNIVISHTAIHGLKLLTFLWVLVVCAGLLLFQNIKKAARHVKRENKHRQQKNSLCAKKAAAAALVPLSFPWRSTE